MSNDKHRVWLGVFLSVFLGWLGFHRAYVGRYRSCIIYGMFSWTGIPLIISWIEALFMPRRVRRANAEGPRLEWMRVVASSVVGFILLFPTCIAVLLPLSYLADAGTVDVNNSHEDVHVEQVFTKADRLIREWGEEERAVLGMAKDILRHGMLAYEEQALPALLAMLPPEEFASAYMPRFSDGKARMSGVQARSVASPRALQKAMRRAQFSGNEYEAARLQEKLSTIEQFLKDVRGRELVLRFRTGDYYYETEELDLSDSIHISYIHYRGEYRLARVFIAHTPLGWEDIFEYVHQTSGTGNEGK